MLFLVFLIYCKIATICDEDKLRYAAIIKRTGLSLTTSVNDILDVGKVDAEQIKIELSQFSLKQLLSDLYALLRTRCEEKHIQLIFEQKGEVSEFIYSDQTRLRQILANIIGNSIKFTSRGSVVLTYEKRGPRLFFTVKDSGVGITNDQLAQLLGGDVGLLKSRPNDGSTFFVTVDYVPVSKSEGDNVAELLFDFQLSDVPLRNKNVLDVEDSLDKQTLAQMYLSKSGVKVELANDFEEGVRKALGQAFDVILMDIQMPIMDGYTAAAELRRLKISTPIIALTGYGMKEYQQNCMNVGCNDYISKPFDQTKLIKTILKYV